MTDHRTNIGRRCVVTWRGINEAGVIVRAGTDRNGRPYYGVRFDGGKTPKDHFIENVRLT